MEAPPKWLLFVHQLPPQPSNLRVRIWRRLQQLGALAVKQAVYVLPDSPVAREDFEWLKTEIEANGGEASVFAADTIDTWSGDALVEAFRRSRNDAYAELARDAERASPAPRAQRKRPPPPSRRLLQSLRERLAAIEQIDFFGSSGRERVSMLISQLEERMTGIPRESRKLRATAPPAYRGRLWVTRPRPGVDRMSSAWLVRRFIDKDARFDFADDRKKAPDGALTFDMFGGEFTHRGDSCTFETLCDVFQLTDPALARIARIVHDLDLKDGRFGATEAPTLGLVIEGARLAKSDDHALLADGVALFEALYLAFRTAGGHAAPLLPKRDKGQRVRPRAKPH